MYSVILATMLTAGGTTTPAWGCHGHHSCHGCYGCYGCYGCQGCYGCYGCYGCWGCYGGCQGVAVWNCCGCQGTVVAAPYCGYTKPQTTILNPNPPVERLPGPPPREKPPEIMPPAIEKENMKIAPADEKMKIAPGEKKEEEPKKEADKAEKEAAAFRGPIRIYDYPAAKATVVVELPADAKLFLNGDAVPLTSARRTFQTPELQAGKTYAYTFRAEVVREGKTLTDSKRVVFQAGGMVQVDFQELTARAAALGNATARK